MARTLSVTDGDIDLGIVDGLEALRQRLIQALQLRRGEYFMDTSLGVAYFSAILGHQYDPVLAEQEIVSAILAVDGVTAVANVRLELMRSARRLQVTADVSTVYGTTTVEGDM